jgi:hypothetical protein
MDIRNAGRKSDGYHFNAGYAESHPGYVTARGLALAMPFGNGSGRIVMHGVP